MQNTRRVWAVSVSESSHCEGWHCEQLLQDRGWNSGRHIPGWVELDLGSCVEGVCGARLTVDQLPDSHTTHLFKCGCSPNPQQVVATLERYTRKYETVEVAWQPVTARFIRVETVESPSWVAWFKIEILQQD
eukprot:TRINITY_DN76_c0_g1_i3.p1 TRINITY_DN76_c0_g1~~TRINITY_DN76_c0_g1_i3.p1  ORF type:complete len:132 (+),score=18.15 TRINITY_DN76_c0_g1_i3:67-462(+)